MSTPENFSDSKRKTAGTLPARRGGAAKLGAPAGNARTGGALIPIAPAQQQIWLHSQMAPGTIYNETVTVRYRGALDPGILERSFHEVIRRHESWRTTFAMVDETGGASGSPGIAHHHSLR